MNPNQDIKLPEELDVKPPKDIDFQVEAPPYLPSEFRYLRCRLCYRDDWMYHMLFPMV